MSDSKEKIFVPKKAHWLWLKHALDPTIDSTVAAICRACVAQTESEEVCNDPDKNRTAYDKWEKRWERWQDTPGFKAWWQEQWQKGMERSEWYLDKIGIKKAQSNFKYWEAMQMKFFKFARLEEKTLHAETLDEKRAAVQSLVDGLISEDVDS